MVILGHHIYYEISKSDEQRQMVRRQQYVRMSEVAVVDNLRYYPEYACGLRKSMKNLGLAGTLA